jgi:phosphotriesterase-related protein
MPVHTVLGPIDAAELGPTSMHEHLLMTADVWARGAGGSPGARLGPADMARVRWNALVPENLVLDDADVAIDEMRALRAAGGAAICDLTTKGLNSHLTELPRISRDSGVTIAVGCGFYVEQTHPERIAGLGVDEVAGLLLDDLANGIEGTGIRPAIIGEVGTNHPPTEREWQVLKASARAGAESGAAVSMHLSWRGADGLDILEALVDEGMSPGRVILGHMDEHFDPGYHRAALQAGAVLGYDTWGTELFYGSRKVRTPFDHERLDMVEWLLSEGCAGQLVIGCDVWCQANLHKNGGNGYDHLFARVAPAIRDIAGGDQKVIDQILIETPRRLLDRP